MKKVWGRQQFYSEREMRNSHAVDVKAGDLRHLFATRVVASASDY